MVRFFSFLVVTLLTLCNTAYCQPSSAKKRAAPFSQGKNKFPFSTADKILLISFTPPPIIIPAEIVDTARLVDSMTKEDLAEGATAEESAHDTLGHPGVREIVVLSQKGIKDLDSVLNKLVCTGQMKVKLCYEPRNAVLFMDKNGKVIAQLIVCFSCLGFETKPQDLYVNDIRECMYNALKKIFADAGVKFGIEAGR